MKNHEGYYDPTAGLAIRSIVKVKKKKKKRKIGNLTYKIGDVPGFKLFMR